jgi:hypothetical protein
VAIVESEKSALIASSVFPDLVLLGAGDIHGLSIEKCQVLINRNIILFPDLNAFEKWSDKAQMLNSLFPSPSGEGSGVRCSTFLEDIATPKARTNGLDEADYIIEQLDKKKTEPVQEIYSCFSPTLQSMLEENPVLSILMDKLQLEEI